MRAGATKVRQILFSLLGAAALLTGCASYPTDPISRADFHIDRAREAFSRSQISVAATELQSAAGLPTAREKTEALIGSRKDAVPQLTSYLHTRIDSATVPVSINIVYDELLKLSQVGALPGAASSALFARLNTHVLDGMASGSIQFTFGDDLSRFPDLMKPSHEKFLVESSIKWLQSGHPSQRRGCIEGLAEYVAREGLGSPEATRIRGLLPSFRLSRSELGLVRKHYAEYAAQREAEMSLKVYLTVKGVDRLVRDDLQQAIQATIKGLVFVQTEKDAQLLLTIERIRHDERIAPERAQTITYAQHEVNLLAAALLMPRNASYLYEQVSGSAEIDYGYSVDSIYAGKEKRESLVRGKVGGSYSRCQNQRIQNVFGGVSSAGFVANDDMNRRCSGPQDVSVDVLRSEVQAKIVEAVREIPQVKAVDQSNS